MDEDNISKAEFLADFFCSPLAKEVYKSLSGLSNNSEVVSSLINFANSLWEEIQNNIEDEPDY